MSDHPLIEAGLLGRVSAVAGWLGVLIIVILSLVPGDLRPHTVLPGPFEHSLAYALTGAALAFGHRRYDSRLPWLFGLSSCSVVFELLQAWIPGRSSSAVDAAASSSGAVLGIFLGAVVAKLFVEKGRLRPAVAHHYPSQSGGEAGPG
jgi:hypothetical protein